MNTNYLTLENVSHNHSFVIATYKLLTATIIAATAGAFLGLKYNEMLAPYYIGLVILEFIFLFGVMFTKNKPGLNVSLLFIFVTLTGITLGPLLTATLALSNGAEIILQSFYHDLLDFQTLPSLSVLLHLRKRQKPFEPLKKIF